MEWVLVKNRTAAEDLKKAHQILLQVSDCLRYPPSAQGMQSDQVSSTVVAQEMTKLIQETKASGKVQRSQIRLLNGLKSRWELFGPELLFCYDIPGLPQDNLQLESLFGRLRRHRRRISGCKSTRELLIFGQAQVLFSGESVQQLLEQIQLVPWKTYLFRRNRLAEAKLSRQFFGRLQHDPQTTISTLIHYHSVRRQNPDLYEAPVLQKEKALHTN